MNIFAHLSVLAACVMPHVVAACDTALVLSIDVSNSIDPAEYRLQVDGMADAMQDQEVIDAMVSGDVAIAVMQWSGVDRQDLSIPWRQIRTALDVEALSAEARLMERAFVLSDTAPAEAIYFAVDLFRSAPECKSRVIDISGDGTPNAGSETAAARQFAQQQGVTINGIAIESMGLAISSFFRRHVITRNGFIITARTHREYPDAIRRKIIRELSQALG